MRKDDAEIIARVLASGDPEGFSELFYRHVVAVEETVARLWELEIPDHAPAVEDAFVLTLSSLARLREPGRFDECLLATAWGIAKRRLHGGGTADFLRKPVVDVSRVQFSGSRAEAVELVRSALKTMPEQMERLATESFFGRRLRPQFLAAEAHLEVARVGEAIDAAILRSKAFLLSRIVESAAARRQGEMPGDAHPSPVHLTDEMLAMLLSGDFPDGLTPELSQHLRSGCEICEGCLVRREDADPLDGILWSALFSESARRRHNPQMLSRVIRRLRVDARLSGNNFIAPAISMSGGDRLPLALAAALGFLGIGAFAVSATPSYQVSVGEEQGQPAAPDVQFFVEHPDRGGDEGDEDFQEVGSGEKLPSSSRLVVAYAVRKAQFVAIVRIRPDGNVEILDMPGRISPGRHLLSANGVPAKLALAGAEGLNRFLVVAADHPLDIQSLKLSLERVRNAEAAEGLETMPDEGLNVSWFDVSVTPTPARDGGPSGRRREGPAKADAAHGAGGADDG